MPVIKAIGDPQPGQDRAAQCRFRDSQELQERQDVERHQPRAGDDLDLGRAGEQPLGNNAFVDPHEPEAKDARSAQDKIYEWEAMLDK